MTWRYRNEKGELCSMREIDEFPDEESPIEERGIKVKEHSLNTEERDKIIQEYNTKYSKISELDIDEVHWLYYEAGFSQRKVAEVLGYSRDQIRKLFKIQEWDSRSVGGVEKEIDPQEVYRICVEEKRSKKEAAEILECKSTRPITRILMENEWKTPLEVKMETEIDLDEVHRLHYDEGWSLKRIANHFGYESKDIIQRMFREHGWIPLGLARQIDRVFDFPSEIEKDNQIEVSKVSFESLSEKENISPLDVARCIEGILSSSSLESRVKWLKVPGEQDAKVTEVLENRRVEVESLLNELLSSLKDNKDKSRVGFVDGKLYIRVQDTSEYNWLNIYDNELFYFKDIEDKFRLVHEMRTRFGLITNMDLGKLIDQLTDRDDATGSGYSDIKETTDEHIRAETLHLILDATGKNLGDIQEKIHCIGKVRSGEYEGKGGIRNPKFPSDPETIDIMFAKFFGLGLSDGHISKEGNEFVYSEKDPDRREIVMEHSKDFGEVHYHEKDAKQIQFATAFGRALRKRGFTAGDKCILNHGLPEFILHGPPEVIFTYFRNLWPEDGCFSIEYPSKVAYFTWDRTVVLKDPSKESEYGLNSEVTDDHLSLIENYGTRKEIDSKNGFKEEIYLTPTALEELIRSKNPDISSLAKELDEIILSNQSNLLNDEIDALRRTGVYASQKIMKISYHIESSRVSISRRGKIYRKRDVMRTALNMLPDDIRKSTKVKEWMDYWPRLRRDIEKELDSHNTA
jgi:AraC-like DNA-binding protein